MKQNKLLCGEWCGDKGYYMIDTAAYTETNILNTESNWRVFELFEDFDMETMPLVLVKDYSSV